MQQCFATGKGHVADFAVSLCAKDVPLSWPSAGLHPCGASLQLEASNVEPYFVLDKQTNRDIRLIALLRKLSSFSEASAALLGQAQVCILVAHQQGPVEP